MSSLRSKKGVPDIVPNKPDNRGFDITSQKDFFPPYDGAIFFFHHFGYDVGEVTLQFGSLFQSFPLHHFLAVGTFFPTSVNGFITPYVDV